LRKANSREGSHNSVSVFERHPPTDDVIFFVRFNGLGRRLDDTPALFFLSYIYAS
jgi:hypothetical protein